MAEIMICYNLGECCNLHLYLRAAFQHVSLLKDPLPFHQQNKQKRKSTCFRIGAINALLVFFSLYEKCWVERMMLQITHNIQNANLHSTYIYFFLLKFLFTHYSQKKRVVEFSINNHALKGLVKLKHDLIFSWLYT